MNSAIERLLSLRVRDIMNPRVVRLETDMTMSEAAQVLADHEITGAPVVGIDGRCVGVLSSTDFALRERRADDDVMPRMASELKQLHTGSDKPLRVYAGPEDLVSEHMSPLVQTVNRDATIVAAGRLMCREHIHRAVIVDEDEYPIGVVSSLDLVAAMVAAIEE